VMSWALLLSKFTYQHYLLSICSLQCTSQITYLYSESFELRHEEFSDIEY
jgi:hypothetical protein